MNAFFQAKWLVRLTDFTSAMKWNCFPFNFPFVHCLLGSQKYFGVSNFFWIKPVEVFRYFIAELIVDPLIVNADLNKTSSAYIVTRNSLLRLRKTKHYTDSTVNRG